MTRHLRKYYYKKLLNQQERKGRDESMRKKKEKSRATYVAGDAKKRRLRMLIKVCVVLLLPTLYFFYSLSGLYIMDVELTNLKKQILWCVLHPLRVYNDKSVSMVLVGGLLWMILSFSAYNRMDHKFVTSMKNMRLRIPGKLRSCLRRIRYCRKMYGFVMTPIHCETIMFSWLAVVVPERLHSF